MSADETVVPPGDELVGTTLAHCEITELLGQGGMARVYRARQQHLDRDVAVKVLPPYYAVDQDFVKRFQLEARAMAKLSHPHIVIVHDAGEDRGRLYIIMEFVRSGNLAQWIARTMTLREIGRIIQELAAALDYAHGSGLVHRDVKPANVLMDTNGRAVLSDFGIAKVLATSAVITRTGAGVGTPEYMSPEQCRGATVDARADIYALGVLLYEMLTGRTPFVADNYTALAHSHIYEPVPPPSRLNPRISPAVQAVVLKALEKDPANRFQHASEMAVTLEQAIAAQMPLPLGMERRPQAGTPLPMPPQAVLCPRCHAPNPTRQRFCSQCGQPLTAPQPGQGAAPLPVQATAQIACQHCQAPNALANRFCIRCGRNLVCLSCGVRNAPGLRFCTACGRPLG